MADATRQQCLDRPLFDEPRLHDQRANQYTAAGTATFGYDANGNLTSDGTRTFTYDAENRLVAASGGITLTYDPLGRLFQTAGGTSGTTQFLYDGDELVAEYDGSNVLLRRYAHGLGNDDPVLWYEGSGLATRRSMFANHQGSIVAVADSSGNMVAIDAYDPWGIPNAANVGRFQYTGQAWLAELGMYYYKARIYSPTLGRFMQIDPIGYQDQVNLYSYTQNDPLNNVDTSGEAAMGVHFADQPIHWRFGVVIPQSVSQGHSGVVLVNNANGHSMYREYGRYNGAQGLQRSQAIPNLTMDRAGVPTIGSVRNLLSRLLQIGAEHDSHYFYVDLRIGADHNRGMQAMRDFGNPEYSVLTQNCHNFCYTILGHSGGHTQLVGRVDADSIGEVSQQIVTQWRRENRNPTVGCPAVRYANLACGGLDGVWQ